MSQLIVINSDFGGFSLSIAGMKHYARLCGHKRLYVSVTKRKPDGGIRLNTHMPYVASRDNRKSINGRVLDPFFFVCHTKPLTKTGKGAYRSHLSVRDMKRDDPRLVATVKTLGKRAWGAHATLKIVKIPDGVKWFIDEYDGRESIHEQHRSWS